jgi:hypothetical protein
MKLLRTFPIAILVLFAAFSSAQDGRLKCAVTDESGKPLPFRAYVANNSGTSVLPDGFAIYRKRGSSVEEHFLANGAFDIALPAGEYDVRIERGLEWVSHAENVSIEPGQTKEIAVVLRRWADMNSRGWYSGDTHIHRPPGDLELAIAAEDLNFGVNLPYWNQKDEFRDRSMPVPEKSMVTYSASRAACVGGQEIERLGNGWGAVLFMGEYKPVVSPKDQFYPLDVALCKDVRTRGAYVDIEKPVWLTTSVCAALGEVDSIGVVYNHFHPRAFLPMKLIKDCIVTPPSLDMGPRQCAEWTLDLYYHLLNCGLRLAASAGTASGVMPAPVGFERTYVKLDGPFSGDAWLNGLKVGRSFGTNGPILDLTVDQKSFGDIIQLKERNLSARITASVKSQVPVDIVEIIHNGKIVASERASEPTNDINFSGELGISPGWIAIRAFAPEGATQIFAQSSPIYLEFNGDKGTVPASGEFYRGVIDELLRRLENDNLFSDPYHKEDARLTLNKARDFYSSVMGR